MVKRASDKQSDGFDTFWFAKVKIDTAIAGLLLDKANLLAFQPFDGYRFIAFV